MHKFIYLAFLLFPLLLFSKTLTFTTIEFPPYVYKQDNQIKGFNVEILDEIFKRLHIKIEYKIVPWSRAVKMVKDGESDAIFPFFKNSKRLLFTDFSNSFTSEPIAMFVLKDSHISYNGNFKELSQYKFGRVRGYSSGTLFDKAIENGVITIDVSNNSTQNYKKLIANRFDILVDNKYVVLSIQKREKRHILIKQLEPIISETKAYLGFSKKRNHKKLISKFNTVLQEIKDDGTYNSIINKYFKN